jgi:hypothetical protein
MRIRIHNPDKHALYRGKYHALSDDSTMPTSYHVDGEVEAKEDIQHPYGDNDSDDCPVGNLET